MYPRLRSLALLIALVASLLPGVSPIVAASAATQPERCTIGDASALFQVSPLPNQVMRPRGQDHPGLLDAYSRCQYRSSATARPSRFARTTSSWAGPSSSWTTRRPESRVRKRSPRWSCH